MEKDRVHWDPISELRLVLYTDANFAGDHTDMTSTSGGFLCIWGPHSFFPLGSIAKKQTCQSLSTTEAETLSAVHGTRLLGYPALDFWEKVFGKTMEIDMFQGNQATMRVLLTGKAPTLRHFRRAHGTPLKWMFTAVQEHGNLCDCDTEVMAADIFTKHFINEIKWVSACNLIGVVSPKNGKTYPGHTTKRVR